MSRRFVDAWDPAVVPAYRAVTDAVHAEGVPIFAQLTHGGPHERREAAAPAVGADADARAVQHAHDQGDGRGRHPHDRRVVRGRRPQPGRRRLRRRSRSRSRTTGCCAASRRRTSTGAPTATAAPSSNRMRLPVEVFEAIRDEVGDAVPARRPPVPRTSTLRGGYGLDYGLRMAEHLEARRLVDYFDADQGTYARTWIEIPPAAMPEGAFRDLAAALTRQSDLPVIAAGRIKRPAMAEEILAARRGRPRRHGAPAHRRSAHGAQDGGGPRGRGAPVHRLQRRVRRADVAGEGRSAASTTRSQVASGSCAESHVSRARHARAVLVVGGGPAGLKTAEIAARARASRAAAGAGGGARRPRATGRPPAVPRRDRRCRRPPRARLRPARRRAANGTWRSTRRSPWSSRVDADVVVVATGSAPHLPFGSAGRRALARRRVGRTRPRPAGRSAAARSRRVVRPGRRRRSCGATGHPASGCSCTTPLGSWQAVGTAEYLAERGHRVVLATAAPMVGALLDYGGRVLFLERASALDLELASGVQLEAVDDGRRAAARHARPPDARASRPTPWCRCCRGARARTCSCCCATRCPPAVRLARVGDCVAPRFLQAVIAEATSLGRDLDAGHRRAASCADERATDRRLASGRCATSELDRCLARVAAARLRRLRARRPARARARPTSRGASPPPACGRRRCARCGARSRDYAHPEPAARRAAVEYLRACLAWAGELGAGAVVVVPTYRPAPLASRADELRVGGAVDRGGARRPPCRAAARGDRAAQPVRDAPRAHARRRRGAARGGRPPGRRPAGRRLPHEHRGALAWPARSRRTPTSSSHVHLADSNRAEPGAGHIDFDGVVAALRAAGYDGALAMEFLPWSDEAGARGLARMRAAAGPTLRRRRAGQLERELPQAPPRLRVVRLRGRPAPRAGRS